MGMWLEAMPVVYWAGHAQLRYPVSAGAVVLCCRSSPGCTHDLSTTGGTYRR